MTNLCDTSLNNHIVLAQCESDESPKQDSCFRKRKQSIYTFYVKIIQLSRLLLLKPLIHQGHRHPINKLQVTVASSLHTSRGQCLKGAVLFHSTHSLTTECLGLRRNRMKLVLRTIYPAAQWFTRMKSQSERSPSRMGSTSCSTC